MAKYRVLEKSFIDNITHEADAVIEYDGIPGPNLEALDAPAEVAQAASSTANIESLARQRAAAAGGDPDAVATAEVISAASAAAEKAIAARVAADNAALV